MNNNRHLIENMSLEAHCLEHNSTDEQKKFRGAVDYSTPATQLILKEEPNSDYTPYSLMSDIVDCTSSLKHLSLSIGLSANHARANRNVALHAYAAKENLLHKRTHESIGKDIMWRDVKKAVIHRYVVHYEKWAQRDGPTIMEPITQKRLLFFCRNYADTPDALCPLICDLRLALFKLSDHLHKSSILAQHRGSSIYLAPIDFLPGSGLPFTFEALLNNVTK